MFTGCGRDTAKNLSFSPQLGTFSPNEDFFLKSAKFFAHFEKKVPNFGERDRFFSKCSR